MSIEYTAKIIFGYPVSADAVADLDDEVYEELIDGGYLHSLDCWRDGKDLLFGKELVSLDCDDCTFVNIADYSLSNMECEYLTTLWYSVFHRPIPAINHYLVGMCG